jgi:hypothetical protein
MPATGMIGERCYEVDMTKPLHCRDSCAAVNTAYMRGVTESDEVHEPDADNTHHNGKNSVNDWPAQAMNPWR